MKKFQKFIVTILSDNENRSIVIDRPTFIIGRSSEADITVNNEHLSRKHLKVSFTGESVLLEELGSSNGSWLEDQKLEPNRPVVYTSKSKIVLGKNNGTIISIEIFTVKIEMTEEITLVRRNPLLDEIKPENKVIVLRSKPVAAAVVIAPIIKKTANGQELPHWEESTVGEPKALVSKIQLVENISPTPALSQDSTAARPDLILRMKKLLTSEAEVVIQNAKSEAEEIITEAESVIQNAKAEAEKIIIDAKKLAKTGLDQVKTFSAELKLKTELESKSAIKSTHDEIEKLKLENALAINGLLESANKQSLQLTQNSRKKAETNLNTAKKFADDLLTQTRTRTDNSIKETNYIVQLKLDELKRSETEIQLNTKILDEMYRKLKTKVDSLQKQEQEARISYESLSNNVEREEVRMNSERSSLESLRSQVHSEQKECNQQQAHLNLEERRFKTHMETELLEQKLKVTQVLSEFQQAQIQRDNISAEINFLNLGREQSKEQAEQRKEQAELLIREIEVKHQKALMPYESLMADEAEARKILAQLKTEQQKIQMDIEHHKHDISLSQEQLQKEKKQIAELHKKTEDHAIDSTETIKNAQHLMEKQKQDHVLLMENELQTFQKQKLELFEALDAEKKKLQKTLNDDALRLKQGLDEDIKKTIERKTHAIIDANETKLATELALKKATNEMLEFQRSIKIKNEALKNEALQDFLQSKEKFVQTLAASNKKHEELKKQAVSELKLIEKEKNSLQKSMLDLGKEHENKLIELEHELKAETNKAIKKTTQIKNDLDAEAVAHKVVMAKFQQDELCEIQILKENAIKDIYSNKIERAKLVSVAVDTNVLEVLNQYKFKRINDIFIDSFSQRISTVVFETIMGKYSADKQKLADAKQLAAKKLERYLHFKKIFQKFCLVLLFLGLTYLAYQLYKSPYFIPLKAEMNKVIQAFLSIDFSKYRPK